MLSEILPGKYLDGTSTKTFTATVPIPVAGYISHGSPRRGLEPDFPFTLSMMVRGVYINTLLYLFVI